MKKFNRTKSILMLILFVLVMSSSVDIYAQKTDLSHIAKATISKVNNLYKTGKEKLKKFLEGKKSPVTQNMDILRETVALATERAKRLSNWNIVDIKENAEQRFDETIRMITDYIQLVRDDGPVNEASKKIKLAALDQKRIYDEKSRTKKGKFKTRYENLSKRMDKVSREIDEIWDSIVSERNKVENELINLKEHKELYVDLKTAYAIEEAKNELKETANDLKKIGNAMRNVQNSIIKTSK